MTFMMENHWSREDIERRVCEIRQTVEQSALAAGRRPEEIHLMAVTKTVPAAVVNYAWEAGITLFGENRAQELTEKYEDYAFKAPNIHFIGTLQTNKVRQIIGKVSCIESVDSLHLAQEISKRALTAGKRMDIFLEVNIGGEASKGGVLPGELERLLEQTALLPGVRVRGLMCIPPVCEKEEETRRYFDQMYKLFVDTKHKKIDNGNMEYLSMGMSADYGLAIRHGSNLVRVGTALFGKRNYQN